MPRINNPMEIFKLLDRSNCRDCLEKTCMAFAVAVFKGRKELRDCPHIEPDILQQYDGEVEKPNTIDEDMLEAVEKLKHKITATDLASAARRIGAEYNDDKLTIKVCGKRFSVDSQGVLSSDIHINPWVAVPFLTHVLRGRGLPPKGEWVSFRELKEGRERYALFQKRCEEPMQRVADTYTELFDDLVHLFSAKQVAPQFESDISVVLHPLPRVPIMVCYWLPEDGISSSLNLFFDRTADQNLGIGALFSLGAGLAQMFAKIALRHGFG